MNSASTPARPQARSSVSLSDGDGVPAGLHIWPDGDASGSSSKRSKLWRLAFLVEPDVVTQEGVPVREEFLGYLKMLREQGIEPLRERLKQRSAANGNGR